MVIKTQTFYIASADTIAIIGKVKSSNNLAKKVCVSLDQIFNHVKGD